MNKICGVYRIYCKETDRTYIGSSNNVNYRWTGHKYALRTHTHHNHLMQSDYDAYGINSFEFSIVEQCEDNEKLEREKYYAETVFKCMNDKGDNDKGYNLAPYIDTGFSVKQHVPHTLLTNDDIFIIKILLSLNVYPTPISQSMHFKYNQINDIKKLISYKSIYTEFNELIENPNSNNIFDFPVSINNVLDILNDRFKFSTTGFESILIQHIPIPIEFIYNLNRDCDRYVYPGKLIRVSINNGVLYQSDIETLSKIQNLDAVRCMLFIILKSKYVMKNNKYICCFSETEYITTINHRMFHWAYHDSMQYLIDNNYVSIDDTNYYINISHERNGDIIYNHLDCNSFDLVFRYTLMAIGISKTKYGICERCGVIFKQNKFKHSKCCKEHRGYNKIVTKELICIDCGKTFTVGAKSRMKVRCDDCQKIYRRQKNREYMAEFRKKKNATLH